MNASQFEQTEKNKNKSKNNIHVFCINCPYSTTMKRPHHRGSILCPQCGNLLVVE